MRHRLQRGSIVLLVIVFGGIFLILLMALSSFVLTQNRAQDAVIAKSKSFTVAEAGLNYYRWFLSHYPGNTTNGTGLPGPYVKTYTDPETGTAGTYTLSVTGNSTCGVVQSIDVTSVGVSNDTPTTSTTLVARFAPPSVADYSMIVGASTWFDGTAFTGPMQSNGGLRMDNTTNNAPITSSLSTWTCDPSYGCNPSLTKPGIFGSGANQDLWKFPKPQMDFAGVAADFTQLKTRAIASGRYLPRVSSSGNPNIGYHLIFSGANVTVKKVVSVVPLSNVLFNSTHTWGTDYTIVASSSEQTLGTYPITPGCGLIFVEDNTWIEGSLSTKVTVVAANVVTSGVKPNIVIPNNITYSALDGSAGLTAIAARDVLIAANSPFNLTLNGIFVAQGGSFGRNMYDCNNTAYQYRGRLTMLGTIVSLLRQNNYWTGACTPTSGSQGAWSGYPDNLWTFVSDRNISSNPPAFTPTTSTQWQFVDWRQQ